MSIVSLYTNYKSKVLWALLLVFIQNSAIAQDNNVWVVDGFSVGFKMDFNFTPPKLTSLDDISWRTTIKFEPRTDKVTVVGEDGKLRYYTRLNNVHTTITVYDDKDRPIWAINKPIGVDHEFHSTHISQHKDTLELIAQVINYDKEDPEYYQMNILKLRYAIYENTVISTKVLTNYNYSLGYYSYDSIYGPIVFNRVEDEMYLLYSAFDSLIYAKINANNQIEYMHTIKSGVRFFKYGNRFDPKGYHFNSRRDLIHMRHATYALENGYRPLDSRDYKTTTFSQDLGFGNIKQVYQNREGVPENNGYIYKEILTDVTSSPSDEYAYMLITKFRGKDVELVKFKDDIEVERISLPQWYNQARLGPDGKIYLFPFYIDKDKGENGYIGVIENPDDAGEIKFREMTEYNLNDFSDQSINRYNVISLPTYDKPHKRVKFTADTACSGIYAAFTNLTDSTHFARYRFYFGDGDSAEIDNDNNILIAGKDNLPNLDHWGVLHRYASAGTYLAKIRAFNKAGGWVWYSDSVVVIEPSVPKFSVADTIGCEWIAYEIQDLSKVVNKGRDIIYHWTFGDGTDSTITFPLGEGWDGATNTRQYKTYSQSGDYKIQLTIDDGYCIDSFSLNNNVEILEAPRPGITAAPVEGCSPVRVEVNTTYSDVKDSVIYTWGDGEKSTSILGESSHTYLLAAGVSTSQYLTIYQSIHGPTGCVTTDSQTVIVHPGFLSADTPYLSLVTVNPDQQIEITWDSFAGATGYQLFRNGAWLADAATSNYTDASTKESLHEIATYTIYGTNVCEEKTLQSNIGQNIVLTGKGSEDNTISFLEWTPYQKWKNGVVDYAIEVQNDDNSFTEIYRENANGTKKYTDETFLASALSGFATYKCYRIAAYELDYPQQISYSNVECVPFKPVVFIPTAFTPNADGLNDVWRPVTFGIEFYEVNIYNRYGQKIAQLDQTSLGWDAAEAPLGAYAVTIRAKGTDNLWYNLKSTVTVVR